MLDGNLSGTLVEGGVGLDEDLTGLLVSKHNVANRGTPEMRVDSGHFSVELGTSLNIGGRLIDV